MSSIERLMFCMTIMCLFVCFFLRLTLAEIEAVNLSKKAIKVRKKGQSFKEWLFCTRFLDVVPWFVVAAYYVIVIVNIIGFLIVVLHFIFGEVIEAHWVIFRSILAFNGIWFLLFLIVSFDPNYHSPRVELWVPNIKTGKTAKRYKHRKTTSGRHK